MWPTRHADKQRIMHLLERHDLNIQSMPGVANVLSLETLALQFVASIRREDYYSLVQQKNMGAKRADPNSTSFDAERAVAYYIQQQQIDEACWLIFLMTHFGRPADTGWLRLKDVYGMLGGGVWNWKIVSADPKAFKKWLNANWLQIRGKFGNHRKYSSLRPGASRTTADAVQSYLDWVGGAFHSIRFAQMIKEGGNNPHIIFDVFYQSFNVLSFGRLGRFDYLALISRYNLAPIKAGSAYLDGATGPLNGARLLFDGRVNGPSTTSSLQKSLDLLDADLKVGMEVMEDALCNWQKSPSKFIHYIG